MKLLLLGGADEIGASCALLTVAGKRLLIDCGLRVNRSGVEALPQLDRLAGLANLEAVLVTHAHTDHTGGLPVLSRMFPATPVYMNLPTQRLSEILLRDAVKIMALHAEEEGPEPLYEEEDVDHLCSRVQTIEREQWIELFPDIRVYYWPAGHIVGASGIFIDTPEGMILFSGDLCMANQRTVVGARNPSIKPDFMVLEATYGDGLHPKRHEEERTLANDVVEVIQRGGTALIPSFALGRAQEIMLALRDMQRSGALPLKFPIYADGLVRTVCDAYTDLLPYLPPQLQNFVAHSGMAIFWDDILRRADAFTRLSLGGEPCCIISSSGMLSGGPAVHYARRLLPGPQNAIFFTGYTDEESPGRRLQSLQTGDTLLLDEEVVTVRCPVQKNNLSAHADQGQLCQIVSWFQPKAIVLVHGRLAAIQALRQKLVEKYLVYNPKTGDEIDLAEPPEWTTERKVQVLAETRERYPGTLAREGDELVIRLPSSLADSPLWQHYYAPYQRIEAKFMGTRLTIKAVPESNETASESTAPPALPDPDQE